MTENEAIDIIHDKIETCEFYFAENDCYPKWCEYEFLESLGVAISALKEIQQYRAIGTVEECREAMEKQKPQNPKDELKIKPILDENGAYVDADTTVYLLCPSCGEMVGIEDNCDRFCRGCGQAIYNEILKEMEDGRD